MSLGPGSLNVFLPLIERLTRLPGRALVSTAAVANVLLAFVGVGAGRNGSSTAAWIPFAACVVFSAVLVFFAVRRSRLERLMEAYTEKLRARYGRRPQAESAGQIASTAGEGIVIDEYGNPLGREEGMEQEIERMRAKERQADAEREAAQRKNTFLSRLEAAQRAAIAQAGGVENVPHLKDDLRWTILSAGLTLASLPIIAVLIIVGLAIWL
ncbi:MULTISPECIES: hypothetical protein [Trueperella]|uniref:Uncharacterized protein n=1 Tax=Trueperella abortisuis TaxID=445930 RepID=A0ABT9PIN1_9ACTO|nr:MULTISPECIES: hypothetical protein [Trueperella]MCI7305356.1 hypothetical protein [Trueperella sp.]MDP9832564.1 hypothetical protein [Trueperella abortisuis]MDY5404109.1 hypothetical protein [Trueperella sp.]